MDDDWQPVLDKLTLLRNDWPNTSWGWDTRFVMLVSSFPKADEGRARAAAARALEYAWDSTSLPTAPKSLQEFATSAAGGLRKGQLLMAGRAGSLVMIGLWWPWRDGENITLRLGLGEHDADEAPYSIVRALFGVR